MEFGFALLDSGGIVLRLRVNLVSDVLLIFHHHPSLLHVLGVLLALGAGLLSNARAPVGVQLLVHLQVQLPFVPRVVQPQQIQCFLLRVLELDILVLLLILVFSEDLLVLHLLLELVVLLLNFAQFGVAQ